MKGEFAEYPATRAGVIGQRVCWHSDEVGVFTSIKVVPQVLHLSLLEGQVFLFVLRKLQSLPYLHQHINHFICKGALNHEKVFCRSIRSPDDRVPRRLRQQSLFFRVGKPRPRFLGSIHRIRTL